YADAVFLRQGYEAAACPLPRKDQLGETQPAHQPFAVTGVAADELGAGAAITPLGVTGHPKTRGVLADFGADFTLEAGPAMHEKAVHWRAWKRRMRQRPAGSRCESCQTIARLLRRRRGNRGTPRRSS